MKIRIALGAVLAVMAMLGWLSSQRAVKPASAKQSNDQLNVASRMEAATNNAAQTTPHPAPATNPVSAATSNAEPSAAIVRKYMESQNVPVEFYGQIVDQDGHPLSDVKVQAHVRHWNVVTPIAFGAEGRSIPITKETDTNGRFEINGETGDAVTMKSFQKDGYEAEPTQLNYGSSAGNFQYPVIFKMWSTNVHEKLMVGDKSFHIIPDGRTYVIDLDKQTISETGKGDLKIWVKRPKSVVNGQRYEWSCEMDIINGGLQSSDSYSMFLAPADGYNQQSFQFEQAVGSGWGDSTGLKRFYIKLRDGQIFGRISVEIYAYYNNQIPGLIRLSYAINPSGSRILR